MQLKSKAFEVLVPVTYYDITQVQINEHSHSYWNGTGSFSSQKINAVCLKLTTVKPIFYIPTLHILHTLSKVPATCPKISVKF